MIKIIGSAFRLECTSSVPDISDIIKFLDHDKSSSVSQLIKGKPRYLQKLIKYFNGTTTSASNLLLSVGLFHIIFVLSYYSIQDLLYAVLLLLMLPYC